MAAESCEWADLGRGKIQRVQDQGEGSVFLFLEGKKKPAHFSLVGVAPPWKPCVEECVRRLLVHEPILESPRGAGTGPAGSSLPAILSTGPTEGEGTIVADVLLCTKGCPLGSVRAVV